jgi:hypothetical protein
MIIRTALIRSAQVTLGLTVAWTAFLLLDLYGWPGTP